MTVAKWRVIFSTWLVFWSAASLARGPAPPACSIARTTFMGWQVYRLTNGLVALTIAPDLGGRALQFELGQHAYFFVNRELAGKVVLREQNDRGHAWANYGGDKDWLAPQGFDAANQWAGPPDYNIDGSRYAADVVRDTPEEAALRVTSPPDDRSGLVLSRTYTLERGSTRVRIEHRMRNVSHRDVRWGFQQVTQSDTADPERPQIPNPQFWVFCPVNSRSPYPRGYLPQYGEASHPAYHVQPDGLFALHYLYQVAQVGLDSTAGWLAAWNGATLHVFVERFKYIPGADYPDRCVLEFYLNGPHREAPNGQASATLADVRSLPYYLETEIISPYISLRPSEEGTFKTEWSAARVSLPIASVTDAGVVSEPFTLKPAGTSAQVSGVFGVFFPGEAEISFKSRSGEELRALSLGQVSPEEVFRLNRQEPLPAGTWRVSLTVRDARGFDRGELGNVVLADLGL